MHLLTKSQVLVDLKKNFILEQNFLIDKDQRFLLSKIVSSHKTL